MKHAITKIILTLYFLIEFIKSSSFIETEINEKIKVYDEILNNSDDVNNIEKFIKKLVLLKDDVTETDNIGYLIKEKLIFKINKILLKIKHFYDDSKTDEDPLNVIYIQQQLNVERLNDITFIFDYLINYNQSDHTIIHNAILSIIKLLSI